MDEQTIKDKLTLALQELGLEPKEIYVQLVGLKNPYITISFEADEEGKVEVTENNT
jgi:hypothetical protein